MAVPPCSSQAIALDRIYHDQDRTITGWFNTMRVRCKKGVPGAAKEREKRKAVLCNRQEALIGQGTRQGGGRRAAAAAAAAARAACRAATNTPHPGGPASGERRRRSLAAAAARKARAGWEGNGTKEKRVSGGTKGPAAAHGRGRPRWCSTKQEACFWAGWTARQTVLLPNSQGFAAGGQRKAAGGTAEERAHGEWGGGCIG